MPLKDDNIVIQQNHPQPVLLKKTVLVFLVGVIVLIIALAIVNAFSPPKKQITDSKAPKIRNQPMEISTVFRELPQDYQDVDSIKKFIVGIKSDNFSDLQKEFETLKVQHQQLEQELAALSMHDAKVISNKDDSPAKSSNLFFTGIASSQNTLIGPKSTQSEESSVIEQPINQGEAAQQAAFLGKQNLNAQKLAVLKAIDNPEDIYDLHNIVTPVSPYEIQAGTIIPAVLITGVNTALSGTVVAQVRNSVYDSVTGKYLLVPKGSKILGEYDSKVSYGQRRVLIAFNRIIRPDGSSILLGKPAAADAHGQSGMEGAVDNHWGRVLGAATLSTILSIGAGVAADNLGDRNAYYPNSQQGAVLGAASGIAQTGQKITSQALNILPTITVPAGFNFNIIVKRDMVLTPYNK